MRNIILFFFFSLTAIAQEKDYIQYHKDINKAEELFFLQSQTDSALYYYDKVFGAYDYIFVKDLVNAAQISIFSDKPYQKYIEQAFEYGLKLEHLKSYPLFAKVLPQLSQDKKLKSLYAEKRKIYLSKINFNYLDQIYKMAIQDQKTKSQNNYQINILKTTDKLIYLTLAKGFPGERLLGISDSTIFKEINKPHLDLYEQRKDAKNLFYMNSNEKGLAQEWSLVMFVHNDCSYKLYHKILLDEVKKGNIHPRDVGLIYDNMFRTQRNDYPSYCGAVNFKGVYRLNLFTDYSNFKDINQTNKMREELFIVSNYVDDKKRDYEFDHDFKLFSGFWWCR